MRISGTVVTMPGAGYAEAPLELKSVTVELPYGDKNFPPGPGSEAVSRACLLCHSAGMVLYQPALSKSAWTKIVDKGHMTALDDLEVRALASRYGDPDEILREDWIPDIPGINVPGNYMEDYGKNPLPHVQWLAEGLENGTYAFFK